MSQLQSRQMENTKAIHIKILVGGWIRRIKDHTYKKPIFLQCKPITQWHQHKFINSRCNETMCLVIQSF